MRRHTQASVRRGCWAIGGDSPRCDRSNDIPLEERARVLPENEVNRSLDVANTEILVS